MLIFLHNTLLGYVLQIDTPSPIWCRFNCSAVDFEPAIFHRIFRVTALKRQYNCSF